MILGTILAALRWTAGVVVPPPATAIRFRIRADTRESWRVRADTLESHRIRVDTRQSHRIRVDAV